MFFSTRWCPSSLAKLVQITPISLWFIVDITIVFMGFINQQTSLGGTILYVYPEKKKRGHGGGWVWPDHSGGKKISGWWLIYGKSMVNLWQSIINDIKITYIWLVVDLPL